MYLTLERKPRENNSRCDSGTQLNYQITDNMRNQIFSHLFGSYSCDMTLLSKHISSRSYTVCDMQLIRICDRQLKLVIVHLITAYLHCALLTREIFLTPVTSAGIILSHFKIT